MVQAVLTCSTAARCVDVMRFRQTPLSNAFGTTFLAVLMFVPGIMGYELHKSDWSFVRVTSEGSPVWWEIQIGIGATLFAVYFWRKAFRSLA